MKLARALLLLLCLLFLAAPGCGITETDVESPPAASAAPPEETGPARTPDEGGVDFRILYRGFTAIGLEDTDAYARFSSVGTCIIEDEDAWQDFMGSFCPGIWYFEEFSFGQDLLVASIRTLARPLMADLPPVEAVIFDENGYLKFQYSPDPGERVYALNTAGTTHFAITIAVISRKDLPGTPCNPTYHPQPE